MAYLNYSQQLYVGFLSAHLPVSAKIDVKAIQNPGYSGSEGLMTNAKRVRLSTGGLDKLAIF